ncbi:hypothetical protein RCL1_005543 [Eukaryota sp. TZLM3-RCL]
MFKFDSKVGDQISRHLRFSLKNALFLTFVFSLFLTVLFVFSTTQSHVFIEKSNSLSTDDVGYFWSVNDIHLQWFYKANSNEKQECAAGYGTAGTFGSFACDTPPNVIDSALEFMKEITDSPDFILLQGDYIPSTRLQKNNPVSQQLVIEVVTNITNKIITKFPYTPLIPALGNHEPLPEHLFSTDISWLYSSLLKLWQKFIPPHQHYSWIKGGYYRVDFNPQFSLLVLNTNYYFYFDKSSEKVSDPGLQFVWFRQELEALKKENRRVLIASHVAPGRHGSVPKIQNYFNAHHATMLKILEDHADIIIAFTAGHEHTDTFRLLVDDSSMFPIFVNPAFTTTDKMSQPSVRLWKYVRSTGLLLDYEQYYLDVDVSNELESAVWRSEYQAASFFQVSDLSGSSMLQAYNHLSSNSTMFTQYLSNIWVQKRRVHQLKVDRQLILCSIRYLDHLSISQCTGK